MRLPIILLAALLVGCGASAPKTATALAERLKDEGITYDELRELPKPGGRLKFDELIALVSDELWVEIVRIEDDRVYEVAVAAGALLRLAETEVGRELPGNPSLHAHDPLVIIVRQEPAEGAVAAALVEIFGE